MKHFGDTKGLHCFGIQEFVAVETAAEIMDKL